MGDPFLQELGVGLRSETLPIIQRENLGYEVRIFGLGLEIYRKLGFPLELTGMKFDVLNRDGESWRDGPSPTNLEAFTQIYEANVRLLFSPAAMVGDHVGESDDRYSFNQRNWGFPTADVSCCFDLLVSICFQLTSQLSRKS